MHLALAPSAPPDANSPDCDLDYRAPATELGSLLARLAQERPGPPVPIPPEIALEVEIALGRMVDSPTLHKLADPVPLSCPSCGGVLSEMRDKPPLRFRCQVGHGFTAEVLDREQEGSVDEALRVALRIVEERAVLADRMAQDARANGRPKNAQMFEERSNDALRRKHPASCPLSQTLTRCPGVSAA